MEKTKKKFLHSVTHKNKKTISVDKKKEKEKRKILKTVHVVIIKPLSMSAFHNER